MRLISLLLLTGPGFLAWFVEGKTELENWRDVVKALVKWAVNNWIIIAIVYLAMYLYYGNKDVSFSADRNGDIWNSVYQISFVAKYSAITTCLAVVLGLFERKVFSWVNARFERRASDGKG